MKTYIVNNGSERLVIPEPSKMSSLSKNFVAQDFTLFLPNGEEVDVFRCATGGASSRIVSLPGRGVSPNKRTRIGSYHREFKEAGKYKLEVIYVLNGANKPSNLTIDYGNCNLKKEYEFEVFDRSGIAFERKAIGWDEYKTKPQISSLEKANDSTYIYNLVVKEATNESLRLTAKYKNLRGPSGGTGGGSHPDAHAEFAPSRISSHTEVCGGSKVTVTPEPRYTNQESLRPEALSGVTRRPPGMFINARRFGIPSSLTKAVRLTASPTDTVRLLSPSTLTAGGVFPSRSYAPPPPPPAPLLFMMTASSTK